MDAALQSSWEDYFVQRLYIINKIVWKSFSEDIGYSDAADN